jgi:hypothetical protein
MPQKRSQLASARRNKVIVRFTRPFEQGSVNGYVIDIGVTWELSLQHVSFF